MNGRGACTSYAHRPRATLGGRLPAESQRNHATLRTKRSKIIRAPPPWAALIWPIPGHCLSKSGKLCSTSVIFEPKLIEFGQSLTECGPKLGRFRLNAGHLRAKLIEVRVELAEIGPNLDDSGTK